MILMAESIDLLLQKAVETGYVGTDVLSDIIEMGSVRRARRLDCAFAQSSAPGAEDRRSRLIESLMHLVAHSLQHDSTQNDVRALFSYDGGMEMSFYGHWQDKHSDASILKVCTLAKHRAKEQNSIVPVCFNGLPFFVAPSGVRSGPFSYSFQLIFQEDNRDKYTFILHTSPCASVPGIRLICHYQAFRNIEDLTVLYDEITHILDTLGFTVDRETLSRIDFNLTINQSIALLNQAVNEDRVINRCRSCVLQGGKKMFRSYRIGDKSTIQLAVYDKIKELQDRYDADKAEDLIKFFGSDSSEITRYEFRLGRVFLHSIEVDTLQDFLNKQFEIFNYLTYDWYTINALPYKKGKRENYQIADWWNIVRYTLLLSCLTNCCGFKVKADNNLVGADIKHYRTLFKRDIKDLPRIKRVPCKRLRTGLKRLLKVGVGCFVSALALSAPSKDVISHADFNKSMHNIVTFFHQEIYDKYKQRLSEYGEMKVDFDSLIVSDNMGGVSC